MGSEMCIRDRYIIVSAEDFALLMGSALVFIVLAAVMMATRNIDWYQVEGGSKVRADN